MEMSYCHMYNQQANHTSDIVRYPGSTANRNLRTSKGYVIYIEREKKKILTFIYRHTEQVEPEISGKYTEIQKRDNSP
jgi:hypothetical protein